MAHVILAIDADPIQHEKLMRAMNNRKYPVSDKREGYNIPDVSEIRFYNVRLKKEIVPLFLGDVNARNMFDTNDLALTLQQSKATDWRKKLPFFSKLKIGFATWCLRRIAKLVGLSVSKKSEEKSNPFVEGYAYSYYFGTLKDLETKLGGEWL